jgi:Family of unknown function (DUF5709)
MTDDSAVDDLGGELEDDGVLDASDTLDGDPGDDPLDQGIVPADRWSAGERYGTTLAEERAGESLDQLLAQEQPEPDPYADDTLSTGDPSGRAGDEVDERWADEDVDGLLLDDGPDPRAGRLVAPDEGAHSDDEGDLIGRDVGIDAGAASAEEAAIHIVDDDDRDVRSED